MVGWEASFGVAMEEAVLTGERGDANRGGKGGGGIGGCTITVTGRYHHLKGWLAAKLGKIKWQATTRTAAGSLKPRAILFRKTRLC